MDPTIELMRLGQFATPDSSPDSPNNNAYGSSPDSAPNAQQPAPSGDPVSGFVNGFLSGFTPQTQARDNLASMMNNMPNYQPPGLFGKIEAGLIGATRGPQAAQQYLQGPYERQMQGWQNQVKVGQQLASDESQANNTGRIVANNQANIQEKYDALGQAKEIAETKAQIAQQRADVYAFRYQNPDWKSAISANGNLILYNPKDPNQIHDTGVTTDAMTPDMKFQLEKDKEDAAMSRTNVQQTGANTRNEATIAGANTRANETNSLKGWTSVTQDGKLYLLNQDTGQLKPVILPGTGTPEKLGTPAKPPTGKVVTTKSEAPANPFTHPLDWWRGIPEVTKSTVIETEPTEPGATPQQSSGNKVPLATDVPLEKRTDGMAAMVGGQLMHWSKASGGWVK